MCPLKEAARDAPNHLALLSQNLSLTFSEFDKYVDAFPNTPIGSLFSAWRQGKSAFPQNPRIPNNQAVEGPPETLLIRTSGSTGTPKIAILPLQNLIANAEGALSALDLRPNDQWKLSLPLYHVGGIGILFRCILARATIVLDDSPNITHLSCVPTHLYRFTPVYKHLRCLLVGGAPIPSYPFPIYSTYGLTEMASMVTLNGTLLPKRELRLSEDGEILVRGECLFQGYLGEKPQNGWFATGDLGRFENGKLTILGRKDWMFISGGENIQPEEIERELLALPDVLEAVVLPKKDPEFGLRPVAILRTQKPLTLEQIQTALIEKLPKYKLPVALYLSEEIPKTNNLKIDRFILSQILKEQLDKNTSFAKKGP